MAMYQDRIFAFTPKGELIQLPKGATPVDFAYAVHTDLGDHELAIQLHRRALAVPGASLPDQATAWNNLGSIHHFLGSWDEAVACYGEAIALNRKLGDLYRLAATLNNLGIARHYSGQYEASRAAYAESLALARQENNVEAQIQAANNLALLLEQRLGRPAEAIEHWRTVVRLASSRPTRDYLATAAQAFIERTERRLPEARRTLQEAIRLARRRAELRFAADLTLQLARVERELGDLPAAVRHSQEAVESIESRRKSVVSFERRAFVLAATQTHYQAYVRNLMELHAQRPNAGWDARALAVSEQARARGLLDLLGEAGAGLRSGVPPQVLAAEKTARARLRELDRQHMELVHQGAGPQEIKQSAVRLRAAGASLEEAETAVRESSESYAGLTTQPLDLRAIRREVLSARTLLLEYSLGEDKSYLFAVTPGGIRSFELPGRGPIEEAARSFYQALTARNDPGAEGRTAAEASRIDTAADRRGLAVGVALTEHDIVNVGTPGNSLDAIQGSLNVRGSADAGRERDDDLDQGEGGMA